MANITSQLAKEQLTRFWLNIYANNLYLEELYLYAFCYLTNLSYMYQGKTNTFR